MSTLSVARGIPMRSSVHPARRRIAPAPPAPVVPVKALIVSAIGHLVVVGAFVALALWGMFDRTTVHVVNLFPSIAAVGTPAGSPAALPTRTPPPPAPTRAPEPEPKPREVAKPAEASLPSRTVAPKVGERDLPPLGMPSDRRGKASVEPTTRPPAAALGQSTGSVAGQGSMTLDVTDFPHAWYLRQVLQKVEERWQTQNRPNEPGQKPRIYVEIQRDGTIATPRIEQSSGSNFYDRAALRAISEASPFPPLPADWSKPALRVLFNFELKHG
jgi:periplasmic protein TonB